MKCENKFCDDNYYGNDCKYGEQKIKNCGTRKKFVLLNGLKEIDPIDFGYCDISCVLKQICIIFNKNHPNWDFSKDVYNNGFMFVGGKSKVGKKRCWFYTKVDPEENEE